MKLYQGGRKRSITFPITLDYDIYQKLCKDQTDISTTINSFFRKIYDTPTTLRPSNSVYTNIEIAHFLGLSMNNELVDYLYDVYHGLADKEKIRHEIIKFCKRNHLDIPSWESSDSTQ